MPNKPIMMPTSLSEQNYLLHKKMFQVVCKYGLTIVVIRLVLSLLMNVAWLSLIADALMGIALVGGYFLSNKLKNYTTLIWPFIIITQASFFFFWFGMGGLHGPAIVFNITILSLYLLIDHRKEYIHISSLVVATTLFSIILEYFFPEWVVAYESFWVQFVDTGLFFSCIIIVVASVRYFISKRYDIENLIATEKITALENLQEKEKVQQQLLEKLEALQTQSFLGEKLEDEFQEFLSLLISATQSQYGFVVKVCQQLGNQKEAFLEVLAVRNEHQILSEESLLQAGYWKGKGAAHTLQELVEAVAKEKNVLTFPIVPTQEKQLTTLVCFPILYNNEMIGMVGIANKENYAASLQKTVVPFLSVGGNMLRNNCLQRQQKENEAALKEAKEIAEQAVAAKNQLFTNISHELRTPLSLVVGPVSALLQGRQTNGLSSDAQESLEMVLRNSKSMLQYINDIMDLAKLASSTLELDLRDNHFYTFIQSLYQAFEIKKHYSQIDYQLNYEANRELVLQFDTKKMEKIINNLLSNAFKYTPDGGTIALLIREEGECLHIEVKDTGVGIDPKDLPYIFDRFYQSNNAQQITVKGTGIGLALAQELAQLQGFSLEIESEINKGTRFFFKMPKKEVAFAQTTSANIVGVVEIDERDPNKPSVLVVEDNHDMAAFVKLVLQNDYNVDLAANGAIGWQALKTEPQQYDLVITDLMMPEMDGFELLQHIKASDWGTKLPVIVLTARADTESKLEALTIGIDEYLTKPFSVEELTIHVNNLIQNAQVRKQTSQEQQGDTTDTAPPKTETIPTTKSKMTAAQREKVAEARRVVLEQLDNTEFSVDDLAKALITSKRQLYRFMRLHTGLTPLKFINEIRLQEARRMLEQGLCSTVKEVSYSIGFMSTRHFSKTYSNRFGKKPSEYLR